jgi:hypothetical protein
VNVRKLTTDRYIIEYDDKKFELTIENGRFVNFKSVDLHSNTSYALNEIRRTAAVFGKVLEILGGK